MMTTKWSKPSSMGFSVILLLAVCFAFCHEVVSDSSLNQDQIYYLYPEDEREIVADPHSYRKYPHFNVFCFDGFDKATPEHVFASVKLKLSIQTDDYQSFTGNSSDEVFNEYTGTWLPKPNLFDWGSTFGMKLFERSCVGIEAKPPYTVSLIYRPMDVKHIMMFLVGAFIFYKSRWLCVNTAIYYSTGMGLGVLCSLAIVVFFLSRRFRNKYAMGTVLFGGTSLAVYLLNWTKDHVMSVLTTYSVYFGGYCALCALVTFFMMYRYQPMRHPRSIDILDWILQVFGTLLMFVSSEVKAFSFMAVVTCVCYRHFPVTWSAFFQKRLTAFKYRWFYKWFPPQRRYLTEQEFNDQGYIETRQGLNELREFCSSPNCNAWKTIHRLKDPKRFADFMTTGHHVTDPEVLAYSNAGPDLPPRDDSDSDEDTNRRYRYDEVLSTSASTSTSTARTPARAAGAGSNGVSGFRNRHGLPTAPSSARGRGGTISDDELDTDDSLDPSDSPSSPERYAEVYSRR